MFKATFVFFFCFYSILSFAQITFEKIISNSDSLTTLEGVSSLVNGEILILTQTDTILKKFEILKLDANGQYLNSFGFFWNGQNCILPSISTSPGGDIDLAFFDSQTNFEGIQLVRFNSYGTLLFSKKITCDQPNQMNLYDRPVISYFNNGDLAISISTYWTMGLARLSSQGDLIWSRFFTADTSGNKNPSYPLCITNDGGVLLPGKRGTDNYFIKLDGNGNVQWSKLYNTSMTYYTQPRSVIQLSNGSFIVGGLIQEYVSSKAGGFILSMSSLGDFNWIKMYDEVDSLMSGFSGALYKIRQNYSGELVGVTMDLFGTNLPAVLVFDTAGNILDSKELGLIPYNYIWDVDLELINSRDILVGYSGYSNSQFISHIYRSDWNSMLWCNGNDIQYSVTQPNYNPSISSGYYDVMLNLSIASNSPVFYTPSQYSIFNICSNTGIPETPDFQLTLAPNPATTHLNIDLGDSFEDGMSYQIIDVLGKVHVSANLSQPIGILDIQTLSPGLYIIEIQSSMATVSRKFIKE